MHEVIAKVLRIRKDRHLALPGFFQYVRIIAERRLFVRARVSERHEATLHHNNKPSSHDSPSPQQTAEKRYEEVGMHGARERGCEAFREYVEVPGERQHRRPAPQ